MAKFNIEMELDWLEDETTLDEALKQEIVSNLKKQVTASATEQINAELTKTIQENTGKIVDEFLNDTLRNKIESMKIPYKANSWDSKVKMIPMSEFVGMQYEQFLNKKVFDEDGCEPRYSSDCKLSINEYFIKKYLERELSSKVSKMIQTARKEAEETIVKTLEQTLKDQLSIDIINRLNIPQMLQNLQNKAALLETKED